MGFLALSLEPDERLVRAAAIALGLKMRVAVAGAEVLGPLGVNQVPSTVFVDSRGVVVMAVKGPRRRGFFERRARELIAR